MEEQDQIKQILIEIKNNLRKVVELQKYNINDIVDVGLKHELYESLFAIFLPITIDGVTKIYFDAFSQYPYSFFYKINTSCDSMEQAEEMAKDLYEARDMPADLQTSENTLTYEDVLASHIIIPKEIKDPFIKALFTIDFDLVGSIKIKDSHARCVSGIGCRIDTIEDIIIYSEPACLKTCIDLFNKNIRTTYNDTEGVIEDSIKEDGICQIQCDYQTLSSENQAIFKELIALGQAKRISFNTVSLFVPCSGEETIAEVSAKLQSIASKLKMQDVLYGRSTPKETYEDFLSIVERYPSEAEGCFDDGITIKGIMKFAKNLDYNLVYDESENLIWDSPELYQKHKNYLSFLASKESSLKCKIIDI